MVELTQNGAAAGVAPWRGRVLALGLDLLRGLRGQGLLLGLMAVYLLACYAAVSLAGAEEHLTVSLYSTFWLQIVAGIVFVMACIVYPTFVLIRVRPARPSRHILEGWRRHFFTLERIKLSLPLLLALPIFISCFSSMKMMIPVFEPYSWDLPFAELDRWLHGGVDPWRLLQPLLGSPVITYAINLVYNAVWFPVIYAVLLWQIFRTDDPRTRAQTLLCFVLTWALLGTFMASLFASGGPCYYQHFVGGENPFAPLMAYLETANESYPIWAVTTQDMLWQRHVSNSVMLGGGISAMPSMHVASAMLCTLVGWRQGRILGWSMVAFLVLIQIGSVHLGWHYAVDGYASILLTLLLWYLAGWLADRWGGFGKAAA